MSEFDDKFFESATGEKLSTAERLKLAKKKRVQQIKKYGQFEKQLEKECGKKTKKTPAIQKAPGRGVRFGENIVLLEAASRNDIEEVRSLLSSGVDPNFGNEDGLTALHQCCIDNFDEMLHLLVEYGASVNACDSELWTPLHAAATCGHAPLCRYLVEQGADLLAVNGDGNMPYDICEHESALDYIEAEMAKRGVTQDLINDTRLIPEKTMLADLKERLENETSLEFRGHNGETPLHVAATNGFVEVAQFLFDNKVSVNVTDNDLWQPIHCAAFWCQVPMLELLLQQGASLTVRTQSGETPIDICDDAETKKRILELKQEFDSTVRSFKSRGLSQRRTSSIRRGSVRRSSMKEKKAMSLKASREEGRWLQDAPMQDEDEEAANSSTDRVPETDLPNSSSGQPPASDAKHVTENSTNVPHPTGPTAGPHVDDDHLSPSRKTGMRSAIRKGARRIGKEEESTELDQRNVESLEDLEKRSEITTLLIEDAESKSEKCNGSKSHLSKDSEAGIKFNPNGVVRGQKGCCCILQ